jgi:Histidine phosphatase superfamily (branch 1)
MPTELDGGFDVNWRLGRMFPELVCSPLAGLLAADQWEGHPEPDAGECPGADLRYVGWRLMTHFLYLVRHGEAGPHDGPLSEAGKEQARLTGQRLSEVPFSAIYHGPLPRAAETAGLIAACLPGIPVSACDLAGDYRPL